MEKQLNLSNERFTVIKANELDAFFMSYGEPDALKHYRRNKLVIPTLKHIEGIKGFDAVHRKCGELSTTPFLITIDADTIIHSSFLNLKFTIRQGEPDNLCFYSKNIVNNLAYGNGGIKIWAKDFAQTMAFHELGSGVDFCWDKRYRSIPKIYSDTKINGSPIQAFRAGYREGIKLTSDHGNPFNPKYWNTIHPSVKQGLVVWCTLGADVEYGFYAIHGALLGVHDNLKGIDPKFLSY